MLDSSKLLIFTYELLNKHLKNIKLSKLEILNIKSSIYDIFERNHDLEQIFYELLDYLEEEDLLSPLVPKIEKYFLNQ